MANCWRSAICADLCWTTVRKQISLVDCRRVKGTLFHRQYKFITLFLLFPPHSPHLVVNFHFFFVHSLTLAICICFFPPPIRCKLEQMDKNTLKMKEIKTIGHAWSISVSFDFTFQPLFLQSAVARLGCYGQSPTPSKTDKQRSVKFCLLRHGSFP